MFPCLALSGGTAGRNLKKLFLLCNWGARSAALQPMEQCVMQGGRRSDVRAVREPGTTWYLAQEGRPSSSRREEALSPVSRVWKGEHQWLPATWPHDSEKEVGSALG